VRLFVAMLAGPLVLGAQKAQPSSQPTVRCNGQVISEVEVDAGRPPFDGSAKKWRAVARAVGLHHTTTRDDVIRTYVLLSAGDACNEGRRAESERILRALPFLADATVRVAADTAGPAGRVRIVVATTDEIPVLIAGATRRGGPSALTLGSANVGGLGLKLVVGAERGFAYRTGAHIQMIDYAAFSRPLTASLDAARNPLGAHVLVGLSHPFLTDLQRGSWSASFRSADDFASLLRPQGNNTALEVRQDLWSVGGVVRSRIGGLIALFGAAAMGNQISPAVSSVIISDSGFTYDSDPSLRNRYAAFHSSRIGALVGVRRVNYVTVTGFDALFASQDIMTGVQVGTLVAPGMVAGGTHDLLLANSLYAGVANPRSFLGVQLESEARRDFDRGDWDSMIGSGRAAWYYRMSRGLLLNVSDEFSFAAQSLLPAQLSINERIGGVRGYGNSRLAGGRRNVVRGEWRWAHPALIKRSDLGIALFADAGRLWTGDAPYGSSSVRRSVGVSLLGAYPTQSKRVYRLDLAIPAMRSGGRGLEIRFSSADPTAAFWNEPDDVTRSRLAPVPSSLFAWPAR
jgi:hypothetical protein